MINKRHWLIFCTIFLWLGDEPFASVRVQPTPRPAILGISHVAFSVHDLSEANYFYGDLLGYKAVRINRGDNRQEHINFSINDRQHLEIYPGLTAGQDERMVELALQVADAEAMRLYLLGKGIKVPEAVSKGREGTLSFVVADPEKHLVRFIQYRAEKAGKRLRKKHAEQAVSDRILHVGITVSDVRKADAFYQDILGFSEIWRGGRPDSVTNWINMRVPEGTDYIEYMLVAGPVNRQQLGVLHHVALQVPSIQSALDTIRKRVNSKGFYTIEAPRVGRNNRWQLNLYDPDGTRVELMEPFTMR